MKVELRQLGLLSYGGQARLLDFWLGRLNIITGESKTGKSAIIHIVNYCLGSGECHVPEGVIRRKVAWYWVTLVRGQDELLIARQNPERGRTTSSNIYVRSGRSPQTPKLEEFSQNINIDGLKELLTQFIGIDENLHLPPDGNSRIPLAANFSHARIFCFQDQSLIDNKDLLFFNQSDSFVAQAIKDTLPYFLGAVSPSELVKRQQLAIFRKEARLLERQAETEVSWQQAAEQRAQSLLAEARQVGLVDADVRHTTLQNTFTMLRGVVQLRFPVADVGDDAAEINELFVERKNLRNAFSEVSNQLQELRSFGDNRDGYATELREQAERLSAVKLLPAILHDTSVCPLCNSTVSTVSAKMERLKNDIREVDERIVSLTQQNPRFQAKLGELSAQLGELTSKIRANQSQINAVVQQNDLARSQQEAAVQWSRIQGRISAFLEGGTDDDDTDRSRRLGVLNAQIKSLSAELEGEDYEDRLRNAETVLSDYMTDYARELKLEHSDGRTRLDLRRLTVVAETRFGSIRLENMGSGDTWVGCHVLTLMALHRLFVERSSPVPAFLILDQPSKAHYPPSQEQLDEMTIEDEDRAAVIRLFKFIFEKSGQGAGFQTIVIDHADEAEDWFQQSVLARWRGGEKLVPDEWPEQS